uniref:T4 RNA ligase 1-like N-terminal domain-containing protein n=1 Tax=Chromera velia CCMP2878 TaxID=1169474 RepID=A0A0G4FZM4_9ALVE|eukprot:Cvel_19479.t1-p1 / transcript=Cvel_19479.t1 / gene=Cvel_19479 / organism=Chromera_velia_CCMP2878 / gene_product=hypothetical protein / transcript_product=hypothetical protein / location=Cvel_scaffold1682:33617-37444(+) / protein_length=561 / sequence_SO=supercontig / SO=protein_coding / is_pseudo=false
MKVQKCLKLAGCKTAQDARDFLQMAPYRVRVSEKGGLISLMYDRFRSDLSNEVVRQSRGLVLEDGSFRPVSYAFDRFYVPRDRKPWRDSEPLVIEEKPDGVLIKVSTATDGDLLVSTNGTIDAHDAPVLPFSIRRGLRELRGKSVDDKMGDSQACRPPEDSCDKQTTQAPHSTSFFDFFEDLGGLKLPYRKNHTYVFELLHPLNPTVVPFGRSESPSCCSEGTRKGKGEEQGMLVHLATRQMWGLYEETDFRFSAESLEPKGDLLVALGENTKAVRKIPIARVRVPLTWTQPAASGTAYRRAFSASQRMPWYVEGFVGMRRPGKGRVDRQRIKLKSPAFVAAQELMTADSDMEVRAEDLLSVCWTLGENPREILSEMCGGGGDLEGNLRVGGEGTEFGGVPLGREESSALFWNLSAEEQIKRLTFRLSPKRIEMMEHWNKITSRGLEKLVQAVRQALSSARGAPSERARHRVFDTALKSSVILPPSRSNDGEGVMKDSCDRKRERWAAKESQEPPLLTACRGFLGCPAEVLSEAALRSEIKRCAVSSHDILKSWRSLGGLL